MGYVDGASLYCSYFAPQSYDPTGTEVIVFSMPITGTCEELLSHFTDAMSNGDQRLRRNSPIDGLRMQLRGLNCPVRMFCGDCGNGGNLAVTFTDGEGRPHICLPNNLGQIDIVKFYGILIHELTHVDQWRDLKKCNCNGERWDGPLPDVPGVGEGIECRECEELEKVAYEQQASFLYPGNGADSKKARDEFVAAGVCVSCARSCGRDPQACPALPKEPNDAEIDEKWIDDFLDHVRKQ